MKIMNLKKVFVLLLLAVSSCNDPETVVTNIIHPDGSVTRKIEVRNKENNFKVKDLQVPYDDTWTVKDSMEISAKGDTTWIRRAEKLFLSADYINLTYKNDSSHNKAAVRHAEFRKRFRWFNTDYYYSEGIGSILRFGYPLSDYLNKEQLAYFYLPSKVANNLRNGADSLKYKILDDSIKAGTDLWTIRSLVSEWIGEFDLQAKGRPERELSLEVLRSRENDFMKTLEKYQKNFDSLWTAGVVPKDLFGEQIAKKYKPQLDSAIAVVTRKSLIPFKDYTIRVIMPGKLTGTNGFPDSSRVLVWPVKSDFFFTEPYLMWAESKTTNVWAWIVSGAFLVFVVTGLIIRRFRK